MINRNLVVAVIVAILITGGYLYQRGIKSQDVLNTYTNQTYGYSLKISEDYIYKESSNLSGDLFVYASNPQDSGTLNVNISTPSEGGAPPNTVVKINNKDAEVYTYTDEHGANRKSYQILHNGMTYEITFAPIDDPRLEAMAQSFSFTE